MQRIILIILLLFVPFGTTSSGGEGRVAAEISGSRALYETLKLEGVVDFAAFEEAYEGYSRIDAKRKEVLTFIDFTKPSTEERMWVIDVKHSKILFSTHVSHGRNSGTNYATSFSNRSGSYQSSLGFYLTENTYIGKNGYSLVLDGLEPGINDNAKARAVVMHGAAYANPSVIPAQGRLGRSLGCPALPEALSLKVIDAIREGSVLYIYADNADYLAQSSVLSSNITASL